MRYQVTIRAIYLDNDYSDFQYLSTVTGCITHGGIRRNSSSCRHAVPLGLFIFHPFGPQCNRPTRQYATGLTTQDRAFPVPGWTPPPPDQDMSPGRELHTIAREWAESMNMGSQLAINASRWMVLFHPSFLDFPNATTSIIDPRADYIFLSRNTIATHRPRVHRNITRYGAALPSLLDALIYASQHDDTNHITLLNKADCMTIDLSTNPTHIPHRITDEFLPRPGCGMMVVRLGSLPKTYFTAHVVPLLLTGLRP